jgi:hypothetical protein
MLARAFATVLVRYCRAAMLETIEREIIHEVVRRRGRPRGRAEQAHEWR